MTHPTQAVKGARRAAIVVLIASISITAAVGIAVLLTGEFGETQGRVLATTGLVAGFSTVALCHLAVVARPVRIVGFVGLAVSALALLLGVILVWTPWNEEYRAAIEGAWHWFGTSSIVAVSLAHANLLLLLAGRRHPLVRIAMAVTLAAVATVALLLILPIVSDWKIPDADSSDAYWRWFGVIAIVDALGTVVLPVVGLLIRDRPAGDAADVPGSGESRAAIPATAAAPAAPAAATVLDARIASLTETTGLDRESLLTAALDAFEAARRGPADG